MKTLHRYPVADTWYRRLDMEHGVTRFWEPHVHPLEQANFFHVKGRDRDLLIDSGMGIVPLRDSFPDLLGGEEIIAVATHTHIDHIGAIHEFAHRWVHPAEAHDMEYPSGIVTLLWILFCWRGGGSEGEVDAPTNWLTDTSYSRRRWSPSAIWGLTVIVVPASCVPPNDVVATVVEALVLSNGVWRTESRRPCWLLFTSTRGMVSVRPWFKVSSA